MPNTNIQTYVVRKRGFPTYIAIGQSRNCCSASSYTTKTVIIAIADIYRTIIGSSTDSLITQLTYRCSEFQHIDILVLKEILSTNNPSDGHRRKKGPLVAWCEA